MGESCTALAAAEEGSRRAWEGVLPFRTASGIQAGKSPVTPEAAVGRGECVWRVVPAYLLACGVP